MTAMLPIACFNLYELFIEKKSISIDYLYIIKADDAVDELSMLRLDK